MRLPVSAAVTASTRNTTPLLPCALASPIDILTRLVQEEAAGLRAVIVFGPVARGEARADSDIDLAVIALDGWEGSADLQERVHARLGNTCDVLHFTPAQFTDHT